MKKLTDTLSKTVFVDDILNGMYDWVRVLNKSDEIIYVNKAMAQGMKECTPGRKCYQSLGRSAPCDNCVSRKAVFDGESHIKEEAVGDRIFSVRSSPVRNQEGDITAVVEVMRDITELKSLQIKLTAQNEKLENDLSIARKLQCRLLPSPLRQDSGIDFAYLYRPCEKIGGDFIDMYRIDDDRTGIYIADVSGHGVPASMLTIFLRSSINRNITSPAKALKELYIEFSRASFDPELYLTVFYAIVNTRDKTLVYSNAGHNVCPFIYSKERFEYLRVPGFPISNWADEPVYKDEVTELGSGDRVFFYTDGIIELRNKSGQQFGEERLLQAVLNSHGPVSGVLNSTFDEAIGYAGLGNAETIPDDITLGLLELK